MSSPMLAVVDHLQEMFRRYGIMLTRETLRAEAQGLLQLYEQQLAGVEPTTIPPRHRAAAMAELEKVVAMFARRHTLIRDALNERASRPRARRAIGELEEAVAALAQWLGEIREVPPEEPAEEEDGPGRGGGGGSGQGGGRGP